MNNVISLFSGVGGIERGLERAGMTTVVQVEIDAAARGVLAYHWPGVARFPDVREVTADDCVAAGFVPGRGVIAAGFPCQDLSVAGRRAGLGGARSGLFWEIVRLADALRPQWLLLENVPGLLSAVCPCPGDGTCVVNGRDIGCAETMHPVTGGACRGGCMEVHGGAMGTVLGALGDLGYGYAYRVLDAQHFGVPQRRRRVFIVGHLGDAAGPVRVLLEPDSVPGHSAPRGAAGTRVAALTASGVGAGGGPDDNAAQAGHLVAALTTRAGATFDDQQTGQLVSTLMGGSSRSYRTGPDEAAAGHLIAFDAAQITHPENRVNPRPGDPSMPLAATGQPMIAHALTAEGADASEDGTGRGTPLVPVAFDWQSDSDRTRGSISTSGTSTLGTTNRDAVATHAAVRRLTPRECERLQGYPDDWTAHRINAIARVVEQADAPRYRQLGNSVAVPVLEWIGRRIAAVERGAA